MRILHLCLSCFYIDKYNYQENVLPKLNCGDGHDVKIVASTETFLNNQTLGYCKASSYLTEYDVPIVRLSYVKWLPHPVARKLRFYKDLHAHIESFKPDVIFMHDVSFGSSVQVIKYKKAHPTVKLYADTHTDAKNSGTNWLSLHILHRIFYRYLVQKALPYLERYFYTTKERKTFSAQNYGVPESLMEFYPLGGIIMDEQERAQRAARVRAELGLGDTDILFVHSGKLDKLKRTTELISAFSSVDNSRFKMAVIGSMSDDVCTVLNKQLSADKRIVYLGWKSGDELQSYLCACNMYLQPGSQSATLENALCCGAPIMTYPHESYDECYINGNGFYVETEDDMAKVFGEISDGTVDLLDMGNKSLLLARQYFDYHELASRLYK